jgi:ribosomal protein S18 acetylase RimI-like enzyme
VASRIRVPSSRVADFAAPGTEQQRADFHAVANAAYVHEPQGSTPIPAAIDRQIAGTSSPQRAFVVYVNGGPVGRVVARVSSTLHGDDGKPTGLLSYVECLNEPAAAVAMFGGAIAWLRTQGVGRIIGPLDGDTWHRYRVNVGPYARPRFPLEPWNPAYYQQLWEQAGFQVVESYSSKWIEDVGSLLPGLQKGLERSRERGIRIRNLNTSRLPEELALIHELSSAIFHDAFLYSPIARDEFLALYAGMERMLDPDLVLFAENDAGAAVGFVFAYADAPQRAVHYKTIGVHPDWRRSAAAAALSHAVYSAALGKGLPNGNHALMRDDNRSQALDQGLGDVFRRYVLYEWPAP